MHWERGVVEVIPTQGLQEGKVRKSQGVLLHGSWHHNPHRCCMADLVLHSWSQAVPGHTEQTMKGPLPRTPSARSLWFTAVSLAGILLGLSVYSSTQMEQILSINGVSFPPSKTGLVSTYCVPGIIV